MFGTLRRLFAPDLHDFRPAKSQLSESKKPPMLELRNPHSILAALQVRPRAVKQILVHSENPGEIWDIVIAEAQRQKVPVRVGAHDQRQERSGGRGGRETERTGAGSATVEPPSPLPLEILWNAGEGPLGLWLALDQIQDPQNLGALFRLAGFFGVRGILLTKDRSASVNATVCDVAAGGAEHVPFAVVANLSQAIEKAQENQIWVLGTCERAESSIHSISRDRNWMLVLGNEGTGLRRLTRERCDQLVSMPPLGPVPSLNVATAAAACLAVMTSPPQGRQ
jgi:23S rRNA (guanosine2251-2'-O)-methyltransferase